ncbi:MAG: glycosyltransferase [Sedimentisphaerales bacterium]|nr:glycosyltransferase [Sedimentisphaerales bacterium]
MSKAKRIFIVADISHKVVKMFLDQMPKLAKGFIRLGHDVRLFSYCNALAQASPLKSKSFASRFYKSSVDDMLADQIKSYAPDIVYVSFARVLDAHSVVRMRQAAPNAVFVGGDGDPWPQHQRNRIATAKELDIVTATNDGEFLDVYKNAGVRRCVFMPNMCDPDTDHRYEVSERWRSEILWTGKVGHSAAAEKTLREDLVRRLAESDNCTLYGCCGRSKIAGIDYLHAISGARIGVNANSCRPVRLYSSDRLTHYLACGAFVLAERIPDGNLLFEDGRHLKYFGSVDEFFDLADWYLKHEAERKKIADAGMQHAYEQFNSVKIAGYFLDLIEKGGYSAPWFKRGPDKIG